MKKLLGALIKARSEFPTIVKDGKNSHFKNSYATLEGILSEVVPVLCANQLAVVQAVQASGDSSVLVTSIYHAEGEVLSDCFPLPTGLDSQKLGGAITYARRYALCSMLNIAAEDDDGNGAAQPTSKPQTQPRGLLSGKSLEKIKLAREAAELSKENVLDLCFDFFGHRNVPSLSESQAQTLIEAMGGTRSEVLIDVPSEYESPYGLQD